MIATTTGLIPCMIPWNSGSDPKRLYAHAAAITISIAGIMKHTPPTTSPFQPPR